MQMSFCRQMRSSAPDPAACSPAGGNHSSAGTRASLPASFPPSCWMTTAVPRGILTALPWLTEKVLSFLYLFSSRTTFYCFPASLVLTFHISASCMFYPLCPLRAETMNYNNLPKSVFFFAVSCTITFLRRSKSAFWPSELPCLLCIRVNPAWSFEESHCRMSPTLTGRGVHSTPGLQWWWDVSCHSALLALPREPSPACGQVPACFMHCSNCSAGSYQGKQLSHKQVTWLSWAWLKCLLLLGLGENKPDLCPDAGKGAWSILVCKLIHQAGFHSGIAFHGRITNMMPERKGKGAAFWEEKIYLI